MKNEKGDSKNGLVRKGYFLIVSFIMVLSLGLNGFLYLNYTSLINEHDMTIDSYSLKISEAYESGILVGNVSGYTQGLSLGEERGYDMGYGDGSETGKDEGYLDGYREGFSQGKTFGIETGYETGYKKGLEKGALGDFEGWGTFVRNPTYQEVLDFLKEDNTDEEEYKENEFECLDFCMMFRNNAFRKGYISYTVWIDFEGQSFGHTIIGFNTTDQGMIYLDPQLDYFVELSIGVDYWKDAILSPIDYGEGYIVSKFSIYF